MHKKNGRTGIKILRWSYHYMAKFFVSRIAQETRIQKTRAKKMKSVTCKDSEDEDLDKRTSGKMFCKYHGTCGQSTDECTKRLSLWSRSKITKALKQK